MSFEANRRVARRHFLATAVAGTGSLLLLPTPRMVGAYPANHRLRLAVFGARYNAEHFFTSVHNYQADIVAWCGPDHRQLVMARRQWEETARKLSGDRQSGGAEAAEQYRRLLRGDGLRIHTDIRRMFDEMSGQIDALVVSDYEHFHGIACGAAFRAGKPVCSERPLGVAVSDARSLCALAAQTKLPVTYRSPGTASGQFRRALELVEDGAIGAVQEAHVWFKRGGPDRTSAPQGTEKVPEGLHWDLWLGPLPWREYHSDWMSYAHWRETSNGGLGSFGPHTHIFPFLALDFGALWDSPGAPFQVRAECNRRNLFSYPKWERVCWELPARKQLPPVTLTWHHGPEYAPGTRELIHGKLRQFGVTDANEADGLMKMAGSLLIGSEGAMVGNDHSGIITGLPKEKFAGLETKRPLRLSESRNLYADWLDACRDGKPHILANFENGGKLSELLMLGNLATQYPGQPLRYDPVAGKITNVAEANARLTFKYREGWRLS